MSEKIIRDPVHDVIALDTSRPLEALLLRLINAAEFQRLRRIRQLGMAHLAYPGAEHSRYSHCLGVMQTARQMLGALRRSVRIDEQAETLCLTAALLHDLGHGPFSHVFERVTGLDHEQMTCRVIEDTASEVHRLLSGHDSTLPGLLLRFFRQQQDRTFYHDICSSQLDADRLDYLLRDNLMTGAGYGRYDLRWLLHALAVDEASGRLAVAAKGLSAVEAYLQARYHMYRNVYFHKVVRSAEGMVKLALQRARRLAVQGRLEGLAPESPVFRALLGQQLDVDQFAVLDDVSMLHCFKVWCDASDAVLARLCRGLMYRRLYPTIDLSDLEPDAAQRVIERAAAAVTAAGGEAGYDLFVDEPSETAYEMTWEIMVQTEAAALTPLTALSPLPAAMQRQLMFRRLHVAEERMDTIAAAAGSRPPA